MSYIEDILYDALRLGIYKKTINRVKILQKKDSYMSLEDLYDKAFQIELELKKKK